MKFLNKYCLPARTAKKMEEINNFQQEPDEILFRAWERFKELLIKCPQHYLTDMQEVILFYNGLDVPTRQILDSKGAIPTKTAADAKVAIQEMAGYSKKWHNGTSSKTRSTKTSDGLAAIQPISTISGEKLRKSLPSSIELNPRDQVKSISTTKADSTGIRCIGSGPYAVSDSQYNNIFSETVPFPRRLHGYCCDNWNEACEVRILEIYDHTLPQKEKNPGSFTLPCFIHNVCFDKAFVDLGASVSVMPLSTYTNLGLGDLAHTRLTIELADRTIKHPRGIAENVLVRIGPCCNKIDELVMVYSEEDMC
ncbi:NUDIX hydrolase 6-like protein [Tanacetum coccineum]